MCLLANEIKEVLVLQLSEIGIFKGLLIHLRVIRGRYNVVNYTPREQFYEYNKDPGEISRHKASTNLTTIMFKSVALFPTVCVDVLFVNNPTPLNAFKNLYEDFVDFSDDSTSSDDDSPYGEDIDYVDASPPDAKIVSSEVVEIVLVGSNSTHADFSQYDSFIFDLSINLFPPADRSDFYHKEFTDELAHIISPSEIARIFEDSRARGFCPSITQASHPQFHLGIQYPNLID
ncbi:hypothetical protein Tco_0820873 [Tanacetum coccineum]|uniref:Uncharacterized protein n=1 Tax=Tanacetum coccineum TaxID=301880 RepID=A0ABQ5ACD4_9ASTR